VSDDLAGAVADGLGLTELPPASEAAAQPRHDLPPSPALSILLNGPQSFAGRKVGALVTDGADAGLVTALKDALSAEGALFEAVTPTIAGVTLSDGSTLPGDQAIEGGPSVLYDAVAVIASDAGGSLLAAGEPAARQFVTDAHRHLKVLAATPGARPLLDSAGVGEDAAGLVLLDDADAAVTFVAACRSVRAWDRLGAVAP
jgi:catalase